MKIKTSNGNFEPCPEYTGPAVCVDVTPLKTVQTQFGPKEKFRFVFEIDMPREDGSRFCVWSQPFTPSYHENAALRPFLKKWMGRELTADELKNFDTEEMVGRPAHITVIHEHSDGEIYANIALIQPEKSNQPLAPSGKFVRAKDRPAKDGQTKEGGISPQTSPQRGEGSYRRAEQPAASTPDHASVKVHVGKYQGHELRDLSLEAVQALVEKWLPIGKGLAKPTADDRRLIGALDWWVSLQGKANDDLDF
jgi:hypothetical protein